MFLFGLSRFNAQISAHNGATIQSDISIPRSRYRPEHEDPVFEPERGVDPDDVAEKERDELAGLVYFDTENMLPVGKHPWKDTQKLFGAFFAKTAAVFTITAAVSAAPFSGVNSDRFELAKTGSGHIRGRNFLNESVFLLLAVRVFCMQR